MPIEFTIDRELGVVFTTASGVLTDAELLEHKGKLMADPDFDASFVELSDVRSISELAVSPDGIRLFAARDETDAEHLRGYKLAIVVSSDVQFGMGRMYEMTTSQHFPNVRIFRDMKKAREWLSID